MVRAWTFRAPSSRTLLCAAAAAPAFAVFALAASASHAAAPDLRQWVSCGLVLATFEACFIWMRLDRFLLSPSLRPLLTRTLLASAAGLGLTWLGCRLLPEWSPGYGNAALIGGAAAGVLLLLRPLLPLLEPNAIMDGVLIVGRGDLAAKLCLDLLHRQHVERFAGQVEIEQLGGGGGAVGVDCRRLKQLVGSHRISRIVVAEPDANARAEITSTLLECRLLGVAVEDAADFYGRLHGKLWLEAVDPGRLVFSRGFRLTPTYLGCKRALDLFCALALLLFALPVIALIALAIKLESPGPVLFRQERVGWYGKRFTLFKFRSMRSDAERFGPVWAQANDGRATRIGRILRRFHLDEIPQALNVLRGDLSFVGPRPERPCFVEVLERNLPLYELRHYVKPGITGWAQVRYPYASTIAESYEKLQYDLYYANHVSWALDVEILLRTALKMVRGGGT